MAAEPFLSIKFIHICFKLAGAFILMGFCCRLDRSTIVLKGRPERYNIYDHLRGGRKRQAGELWAALGRQFIQQ